MYRSHDTKLGRVEAPGRTSVQVRREIEGALTEPTAISHDGSRVAVVVREGGERHLSVMSTDGTNARTLAPLIDIPAHPARGPQIGRRGRMDCDERKRSVGTRLVQDSVQAARLSASSPVRSTTRSGRRTAS